MKNLKNKCNENKQTAVKHKVNSKRSEYYKSMERLHRSRLESIANDPSIIGINYVINTEIELPLYSNNIQIGEIDLLIYSDVKNYLIEYKCNGSEPNRYKAKSQLIKEKAFMDKQLQDNVSLLYIHNNYIVEEWTSNGWKPFNTHT